MWSGAFSPLTSILDRNATAHERVMFAYILFCTSKFKVHYGCFHSSKLAWKYRERKQIRRMLVILSNFIPTQFIILLFLNKEIFIILSLLRHLSLLPGAWPSAKVAVHNQSCVATDAAAPCGLWWASGAASPKTFGSTNPWRLQKKTEIPWKWKNASSNTLEIWWNWWILWNSLYEISNVETLGPIRF